VPVVAEPVRVPVGILQRDVRKGFEVHVRSVDLSGKAGHAREARAAAGASRRRVPHT
jgi:hypothetical protein